MESSGESFCYLETPRAIGNGLDGERFDGEECVLIATSN